MSRPLHALYSPAAETEILNQIVEAMMAQQDELIAADGPEWDGILREACRQEKFRSVEELDALLAVC